MKITLYTIILLTAILAGFTSCAQKTECQQIIYEIPQKDGNKIAERLELENFEKVIVNIRHENEMVDLCFQTLRDSASRYNELYQQTNRFLKIDTTLIPAITSEDLVLTQSKYPINRTGCSFKYRVDLLWE